MKLLPITLLVVTALSGSLSQPAMGQTIATEQFPRVANPGIDEPPCFVETSRGTTLNLTALCGRVVPMTSPSAVTTPGTETTANPAPGTSPSTPTVTRIPAPGGTIRSDEEELGIERPRLNLPNVPGSAFSPGGVAPTREAITGPRE